MAVTNVPIPSGSVKLFKVGEKPSQYPDLTKCKENP